MTTITSRQMAAIKRVAQNVNAAVTKKAKLATQIELLQEEYHACIREINAHEQGIKALTGYGVEDLVHKVVTQSATLDKNGNYAKITKYEPNSNLTYNEETKLWEIKDFELNSLEENSEVNGEAIAPEREEIPAKGFNPTSYDPMSAF